MKKIVLNYIYLSKKHAGGKDQVGINLLKGFYENGYSRNMWIICFDYSVNIIKEIAPDINILEIKSKKNNSELVRMINISFVNTFLIPKMIKENNFDIVFHLSCNTGVRKYKCKSIVLPHDIKAVSHRKLSGIVIPFYKYILHKLLYYFDFRTNDIIIAISDTDREEISTYYPQFKSKIQKIYNPIDVVCPYKKRIKIGKDIVAINLQFHHKNIITLIKAYELIKEKTVADLVLVGSVPERVKYLKEYVKENNLTERVIFKGFVDEEEKNRILQESRLYVNPSLFEGFGMTAVEAMIFQVPTLVAEIKTNVEVTKGMCSYYAPAESVTELAKRLLQCLENDDSNLEMKSRIISEEYNYLNISKKYYKLFVEI